MEPKFTGSGKHRRFSDDPIDRSNDARLLDDDAFLTSLSHGTDPSGGRDELAALFLELRSAVEAPMPAAPTVPVVAAGAEGTHAAAKTAAFGTGDSHPATEVISLDERRAGRHRTAASRGRVTADDGERSSRRFRTNPWAAGLVGAAAATVVVAGAGAGLYNAAPGSALWGPSKAVFGERADIVELASALDEIENKTESGDIDGARTLIWQLRETIRVDRVVREPESKDVVRDNVAPGQRGRDTVTVTSEVKRDPEAAATVTVTPETVTVTVTVTPPAGAPAPAPSGQTGQAGQAGQTGQRAATPTAAATTSPAPVAPSTPNVPTTAQQ